MRNVTISIFVSIGFKKKKFPSLMMKPEESRNKWVTTTHMHHDFFLTRYLHELFINFLSFSWLNSTAKDLSINDLHESCCLPEVKENRLLISVTVTEHTDRGARFG